MKHAAHLPEAFKDVLDEETYKKSVAYTLDKIKFGLLSKIYDAAYLALILFSGLLASAYTSYVSRVGSGVFKEALFIILVTLALSIPSIPFELWSQFKIEEKFGFNRTTIKLWCLDKIKALMLSLLIGYPILLLLLSFIAWSPRHWWIWGFSLITGFQFLMLILYPKLILPIFNKLSPLNEGTLKERLMKLVEKTGFNTSSIHVMDGSRRSTHSNAFFTGFGKFRRVILYDTLVDQLSEEELEGVLAHEIGHYKKGHVPKSMLISSILMLVGFYLLSVAIESQAFYETFHFQQKAIAPAFILFSLLLGLFTFWLTPLFNLFSRKNEYEADAFAVQSVGNRQPLVTALRKLNEKNLSNLTPHPIFSFFYYSHPTLLEREAAMSQHG